MSPSEIVDSEIEQDGWMDGGLSMRCTRASGKVFFFSSPRMFTSGLSSIKKTQQRRISLLKLHRAAESALN